MYKVLNICFYGAKTITVSYKPIKKIKLDDVHLMQHTGYKDLYKYDILQFGTDEEWYSGDGERGYIDWDKELDKLVIHFCSIYGGEGYTGNMYTIKKYLDAIKYDYKLIGNCFENSDLLTIDISI